MLSVSVKSSCHNFRSCHRSPGRRLGQREPWLSAKISERGGTVCHLPRRNAVLSSERSGASRLQSSRHDPVLLTCGVGRFALCGICTLTGRRPAAFLRLTRNIHAATGGGSPGRSRGARGGRSRKASPSTTCHAVTPRSRRKGRALPNCKVQDLTLFRAPFGGMTTFMPRTRASLRRASVS